MELRQLETFVIVAAELHFGRSAERLNMSASMVSETIQRLEAELRAPLFLRSTRRVELTPAGIELSRRAKLILHEVAEARGAVQQVAQGNVGIIRLGVTPPAALVLAPHLRLAFTVEAPDVVVEIHRFWLPDLGRALADRRIDVAITCGELTGIRDDVITKPLCADRLLIGLRSGHRLEARPTINLLELKNERLGMHPAYLFPPWPSRQRQVIAAAGICPPIIELVDTDLVARRWLDQRDVDWILLISSFSGDHTDTVIKPLDPEHFVPFTVSWLETSANASIIERFLRCSLRTRFPTGWIGLSEQAS